MNASAMLKYATDYPAFIDVPSLTPTGTFEVPELPSDLDEQANSVKFVPEQQLVERLNFFAMEPRDETDIQASFGISKRPSALLPGVARFYPSLQPPAREVEWTHHLTAAPMDDDIWDQLARRAPERAFTRWFTAMSFAQEEAIQLDVPLTGGADRLLTLLVDSPSKLRNDLSFWLIRLCSPDDILDASLTRYEQTCQERYLLQAVSLLESIGKDAWRTLRTLIRSGRRECELFIGLIARCDDVSANERVSAIKHLAANPHAEVRSALIDQLPEFDEEAQRCALKLLRNDVDSEVRQEAEEYLVELE